MKYLVLTLVVAAAITAPALHSTAADVPPATQDFIDKASVANTFEIDTSKLALEYSKAEDVKNLK
jgi:putative membrane protein